VDAETYRAESRASWERVAAGWRSTRAEMQRAAAGVSEWMLDAVDPRPGQTVLELASGPGDTGLMAAQRVAPDGRAIITDGAQGMVDVARARAEELGVTNAELRTMEAEWIDLPAASVDAVLCRWGLMLLADPEAALREMRRVLRPGGRLALAVWDAPDHNPWIAVAREATMRLGVMPPPPADEPGPFALADPARLGELIYAAGFDDVEVDTVDLTFEADSLDAWWDHLMLSSPRLSEAVAGLSPADHYALRDAVDATYAPWVGDGGRVRLPGRTLVAAATA
jgi:SAM-dependent methyltransferase